jgi:hypothetical protein
MRRFLIATILVVSTAGLAAAQAPDLQPPAEVSKLGWLAGKWSGSGGFSFGGMEMTVNIGMEVGFDGQFLKIVSKNDYGVLVATETMMLGYDAAKSRYTSWAFTNITPVPRIEHGTLEGDSLVMVSEPWPVMGQDTVSRSTMTKLGDTKVKFKLEFKAGESWEPVAELELTKA